MAVAADDVGADADVPKTYEVEWLEWSPRWVQQKVRLQPPPQHHGRRLRERRRVLRTHEAEVSACQVQRKRADERSHLRCH